MYAVQAEQRALEERGRRKVAPPVPHVVEPGAGRPPAAVAHLSRAAGNQAVVRALRSRGARSPRNSPPTLQRFFSLREPPDRERPDEEKPYRKYTTATGLPEYWRQRFHAHVSVAPEHSAAYDALLDRLIKDVLGQSVKWQWRDFTVRLRERWDAEIRQLPVPARGAAAPVYRDEDLYSAVLRDFYTHIALSVNGRDVYTARNNTAEDTHAEDEVIRELLKDANWVAWRRSGIAHGHGDLVHVQLTNSPCGTRCAGRLVQCLAHLRDRDPQLQMKISFMNAHELAQGNFKTSITTLEQAGIETVAVSGASLADRARAAILAKYPEQLDEERLTDLIAARTQRDAATKRAHDEVVATFTFPRQPAQQRQAPVPTAQVPPAVVAAVFAIFFLAWLQSVLWAQDAATK